MHEVGEGEDADKAADFSHGGSYAVCRCTDIYREDLGGIDEGGGIGPELREEVAEPVDEHKRPDEFLHAGNESEQAEGDGHHAKAQVLNRFAAELVHGECGDRITGRGEDGEDTELGEGLL